MNLPPPGHEAVAVHHLILHAEVARPVPHQLVHLFEGAFVQQQVDALPRRELALLMLFGPAFLAAPSFSRGVAAAQLLHSVRHTKI